jgi:SAM-dependent methyltransferase
MDNSENLSEYADPEIYDLENQDFAPDGQFFLDYAKKVSGSVLELGCGSGRVTIPLAQNDVPITGLDIVPAMIEKAKQKAGDLPILWVVDDIRQFHLDQKYQLIFETGSVFHHLLSRVDQEQYLARVREHLDDNGKFILCLIFPHPELLVSDEVEKEWIQYEGKNGQTITVSGTDLYDPLQQVKLETAYRRWIDESGQQILKIAPLSLRYTFPQEMEMLLNYNGFDIAEKFGDWDHSPLTGTSRFMIFVCNQRK